MKKFLLILISIIMLSGCGHSEIQESSDIPSKVQESSVSESTEEISFVEFPKGLSTYSKDKLKYTDGSITVIFTDEFYIENKSYTPKSGVYLQNADGTATLLAESIEDTTLTYRQMSEYLKNRYPEAKVYTSDRKDVICKMTTTDQSGNEIFVFRRIKVKNGGYNELTLCCRPEERSKYERVFNETSLT